MNRFSNWMAAFLSKVKLNTKKISVMILSLLNISPSNLSKDKELVVSNNGTQTQNINSNLSTLCWSVTAILLSFLCLTHFGVMFCFTVGWRISIFLAPAALLLALAAGDWFARREELSGMLRIASPVIAMIVLTMALFLAAVFFDMSWDGLWYHQTAVYQMSHGWNPLRDPLHDFAPHLRDWLRFYAKGPWYFALAIFATTNNIEMAKAEVLIAFVTLFITCFALMIDLGQKKRNAAIIAALISLNPVITCQLVSYLVDGLMISFLIIFIAAMINWYRKPSLLSVLIAISSAVLCINSKFTGLVYICFFMAAGGIFLLIKKRKLFLNYVIIQTASIIIGVLVFGWNPYVTNTICRGNPFYPMLGSSKYPSLSAMGQDPIELYETPHNMMGQNRFIRQAYSIFGRPGAQPALPGDNAVIMFPFDIGWKDFELYYIHDVRISGFGPLFSGVLILSLVLIIMILFHAGTQRLFIILLCAAIVLSLLVSPHTWWARYGPQLWLLPIVAIVAGFTIMNNKIIFWSTRVLVGILLINAVLIAAVHFRWEAEATRTTNEQLSVLRQSGDVEIDFQYFREPFSERLRNAGVTFHATHRLQCDNPVELMSVAPGYPGAVRACIK